MKKFILGLSVVALMLPGVAMAGPPAAFDAYTVTGGAIATTCPAGFTCGSEIVGDGFMQRPITDNGSGTMYFQTVLTDAGVTGDPTIAGSLGFRDENFVASGTTSGGIAGQSVISESSMMGTFDSTARIDTGWATVSGGAGDSNVVLSQTVTGSDLSAAFDMTMDMVSGVESITMSIDQTLDDSTGIVTDDYIKQRFILEMTEAAVGGTATLSGLPVTWSAADEVSVVWIGQSIYDGSGMTGGATAFGFEKVADKTTAIEEEETSLVSTGPFDWAGGSDLEAVFGTAPVMP